MNRSRAGYGGRRQRALAVAALVLVALVAGATPALAHSALDETDPPTGATLVESPKAVTLTFNDSVEVSLGGIKMFDSRGRRVDVGAPRHPGGDDSKVRASTPDLVDGSYVVTWRVVSADSHPIRGAFTFSVGTSAKSRQATTLAQSLLPGLGGSSDVGVLWAIARFGVFVGLLILLGSTAFLAWVWTPGRGVHRAVRLVWGAWGLALGLTLVGFAVQGPYGGGLPLGDVLNPSVWSEVAQTRFGHIWLARVALLVLTIPLLRTLLPRRVSVSEFPLPQWWPAAWALLMLGLASTPGLAAHAASGPVWPFALFADTLHVFAVGLWLGGLMVLLVALLPLADEQALRAAIPRYSRYALLAMGAIVATGVFQTLRQVRRLGSLLDTDYGRFLSMKVLVFGVLMIVAALSRDVVNRRWRIPSDDLHALDMTAAAAAAKVGARGRKVRKGEVALAEPVTKPDYPEGYVLDEPTAERRLRGSLITEVVISAVILALTALLVNTAPAREQLRFGPYAETVEAGGLSIDTVLTPARPGRNEVHVTVTEPNGKVVDLVDFTAQLSEPVKDIAPIDIPFERASPGHYISRGFTVPFAGEWQLTMRASVSDVDQKAASVAVPFR